MSRRNKRWWKSKNKYTTIENLEYLKKHARDDHHKNDVKGFYDFYIRNGYITSYMATRVLELTGMLFPDRLKGKHVKVGSVRHGKHYLYAIKDGLTLKVGYSQNPKDRLAKLQTGSARTLKIVWTCLCAYNDTDARRQEKKLHRRLHRHHIKGEWYEFDCLIICRGWRISGLDKMRQDYLQQLEDERVEQEIDLQTLREIQKLHL
jgi:hypothetical protein